MGYLNYGLINEMKDKFSSNGKQFSSSTSGYFSDYTEDHEETVVSVSSANDNILAGYIIEDNEDYSFEEVPDTSALEEFSITLDVIDSHMFSDENTANQAPQCKCTGSVNPITPHTASHPLEINKQAESEENLELKSFKFNYFVYSIFKKLLSRYIFINIHSQLYYYFRPEGIFKSLSDNQLKILIRQDWDEKTSQHLTKNAVAEIIDRITTEPSIQDNAEFNPNSNLINFKNGVLDILTKKFKKHSPQYLFTNCIQTDYDPDPQEGRKFKEFIMCCTRGNYQKEIHLQEILGYLISEYSTAKKVPFFIGQPNSGKSLLLNLIAELIGPAQTARVPLNRLHERFILAHLSNKKLNIFSELSSVPLTHIDVFKSITGNDELVAEFKGKDHFTYKSRIKLVFAGNIMPSLKNSDLTSAFFNRLTFILFNYSVPENDRDYNLLDKLMTNEAPYIVAWAIKGLNRLVKNNFIFTECQESIDFKNNYILSQNTVVDFIKSNCSLDATHKVHARMLYRAYLNYCNENCCDPLPKEAFASEILDHNITKSKFRINKSNPLWGYIGISLNEDHKN